MHHFSRGSMPPNRLIMRQDTNSRKIILNRKKSSFYMHTFIKCRNYNWTTDVITVVQYSFGILTLEFSNDHPSNYHKVNGNSQPIQYFHLLEIFLEFQTTPTYSILRPIAYYRHFIKCLVFKTRHLTKNV